MKLTDREYEFDRPGQNNRYRRITHLATRLCVENYHPLSKRDLKRILERALLEREQMATTTMERP